jgi:predicted MPP superfamily phosphohydrolase
MLTFLVVFFALYGAAHIYLAVRLSRAFILGACKFPLALFMLVMIAAPALIRIGENAGFEDAARIIAYTGYSWMGFLFVFICSALTLDLFRFPLFIVALFQPKMEFTPLSPKTCFLLPALLSLAVCGYGFSEAQNVQVKEISLPTEKLPAGRDHFRIVQISDMHLGLMVGRKQLADIIWQVEKLAPDLLVSTGDLVDGQRDGLAGLACLLSGIDARHGKLAVTGNHEFYAGIGHSLDFTKEAGFTVLRGETAAVSDFMVVAGVDDQGGHSSEQTAPVLKNMLPDEIADKKFVLLLKHRPEAGDEEATHFDLQLSGHTHGGQIFPFGLLTAFHYPFKAGILHRLENKFLYVSRGTGTWGPPIRFLSPPEITVIDLKREAKPAD